jgi:hypothetical protein
VIRDLVILLALAIARPAAAHPLSIGYLRLDVSSDAVAVDLDLDIGAAAVILGVEPKDVDAALLRTRGDELASDTYRLAPIRSDAGACAWTHGTARLRGTSVFLDERATCDDLHAVHWSLPFVTRVSSTFQLLISARGLGAQRVAIVDKVTPTLDLTGEATTVHLLDFVWKGVEHIGVAPSEWLRDGHPKLPDGIDHILFLLALLLGGGSLVRLVGIASGFTLGHTITLGLAAFGVLRPPASVIEPLIALSIAAVAVEAFTGRFERHRWKLASAFGLIHGFGFAGALTKLDLSRGDMAKALFGYNAGVELGQIVIVLAAAPIVMLVYRQPKLAPIVVRTAAAAIFAAAMYWFVVRLIG